MLGRTNDGRTNDGRTNDGRTNDSAPEANGLYAYMCNYCLYKTLKDAYQHTIDDVTF